MKQINKDFNGKTIRIIEVDNNQYFVLTDVCKVLEIRNTSQVRRRISLQYISNFTIIDRLGRERQNSTCVTKAGLLEAIANSKKGSVEYKTDFLKKMDIESHENICLKRNEEEFVATLEMVIKKLPFSLLKQKRVAKYNVDIFIPEINLVIEYDEDNHRNYCKLTERKREKEIRSLLDCEFIRISDREPHLENVSIVLGKIFEIFNRRDLLESTYESI